MQHREYELYERFNQLNINQNQNTMSTETMQKVHGTPIDGDAMAIRKSKLNEEQERVLREIDEHQRAALTLSQLHPDITVTAQIKDLSKEVVAEIARGLKTHLHTAHPTFPYIWTRAKLTDNYTLDVQSKEVKFEIIER